MTSNQIFGLCISLCLIGASFFFMAFNWYKHSKEEVDKQITFVKVMDKVVLYVIASSGFGLGFMCLADTFPFLTSTGVIAYLMISLYMILDVIEACNLKFLKAPFDLRR